MKNIKNNTSRIEKEEHICCDGECNHDACCGKISENCPNYNPDLVDKEVIVIGYESGKEERIPYPSQNLVEEDRFKIDKTPETEKDIQQSKDFYNIHSDSPVCPAHKGSLSEDWQKDCYNWYKEWLQGDYGHDFNFFLIIKII